jgi:hypothetical protein
MRRQDFDFMRQVLQRMSRPSPMSLNYIEGAVRAGFANNFARQQVGGGAPWATLRPRTQAERRRQGYGASSPILRRSGAYMLSWTRLGGWRQLEYGAGGWTLRVSSDHKWAFEHELGVRSRNLPARPVRYLDNADIRGVGSAVERWVDSILAYFT